jgi:hypothetical protein
MRRLTTAVAVVRWRAAAAKFQDSVQMAAQGANGRAARSIAVDEAVRAVRLTTRLTCPTRSAARSMQKGASARPDLVAEGTAESYPLESLNMQVR